MRNYLFKGSPGTGKTYMARAAAYYLCDQKLNIDSIYAKDIEDDIKDIETFISSDRCEYVQVHPSMCYEDIVYGVEVKAVGTLTVVSAEKRIKQICDRASGKSELYCVILDDITRNNAGSLLGNLLYAVEYRNEQIDMGDGHVLCVPDNVVFIFTECTGMPGERLDYALRRRMEYVKNLVPDRDALDKYYGTYISGKAKDLILEAFDGTCLYIQQNITAEFKENAKDYYPGHGLFMVPRVGSLYYVLDNVKQKIIYQVIPHIEELHRQGILNGNLDSFVATIIATINTGVATHNNISKIEKIMVNSGNTVAPYSLADTTNYLSSVIIPSGSIDHKGILESIIDAIILNGVFPYDIAIASLLMNTRIIAIPSKTTPIVHAAYLVNKNKANNYYYVPSSGGEHAYYSTRALAKKGRWVPNKDMAAYKITYNDGTPTEVFVPLNGLRAHIFSGVIKTNENAAEIYGAAFNLISYYLRLFENNIALLKDNEPQYCDLYDLILLEVKYLRAITDELRAQRGEQNKIKFFGNKIINFRTLWTACDDDIVVDKDKFDDLRTGVVGFSLNAYEDMYTCSPSTSKTIQLKGVVKMTDLKDYQKIMDNIGVRQMIFQGPPGTSKTFESKKFVLKQLNPSSVVFGKTFVTQEEISSELSAFKLTSDDYNNPTSSSKLSTGGWDLVQFHPSYGYEDFIRGIEVKTPGGVPTYNTVNRILGKIAEFAKIAENANSANPPKFYLVVDEINRANLATVFGELIYGLEYRDSKVSTPYEVNDLATGANTKDIVLGKNLYIIGTMNTADKSIDTIDYAIRRRFIFIDSPADRDVVISCYQSASGNLDENSIELLLFDGVQAVFDNDIYFNSDYSKSDVKLSHTYFLRKKKIGYLEDIIERFVFQVIPILKEYIKDGILDTTDDLKDLEHTAADINAGSDPDMRNSMIGDNIMLYAKEFGNKNRAGAVIDNQYIGEFVESLTREFGY